MALDAAMTKEFSWLDLRSAIKHESAPLDFVLPGFKSGTVGALVSPGAAGKTMLALQAAVTVACGSDLLGLTTIDSDWRQTTGPVVFLTGEDPTDVLNGRFHAIGRHLNTVQRESIFKKLAVAPLVGFGTDIMTVDWRHWIESVTQGARLVVFDTLRRFHQLDENDGGHMARLLAYMEHLCRINGISVLFLHHTSKAGAMNGGDAQQASRGSSVLTDNVRFQANLIGMGSADAEKWGVSEECRCNFVRLSFPKLNYSAPIPDKWYRRTEGGVLKPAVLERKKRQNFTKPKVVARGGNDNW